MAKRGWGALNENNYIPIACGLHENYQYAVLKGAPLDLCWRLENGQIRQARLVPLDVFTREGAEYLCAETVEGERHVIRLDRILHAHWASDGRSLDPLA
jgi:Rho-binding antiterminator